jgi:hypothetical protein
VTPIRAPQDQSPNQRARLVAPNSSFSAFLVNMGVAAKGRGDCGAHEFHNADGKVERCYHCEVGERPYDPPFRHELSPSGAACAVCTGGTGPV